MHTVEAPPFQDQEITHLVSLDPKEQLIIWLQNSIFMQPQNSTKADYLRTTFSGVAGCLSSTWIFFLARSACYTMMGERFREDNKAISETITYLITCSATLASCMLYSRLIFLFIKDKFKRNSLAAKEVLKKRTACFWLLQALVCLLALAGAIPGAYITYQNLFPKIGKWSAIFAVSTFIVLITGDIWSLENLINSLYIQIAGVADFFSCYYCKEVDFRARVMQNILRQKQRLTLNQPLPELADIQGHFHENLLSLLFKPHPKGEKSTRNRLYWITAAICTIGFIIGFVSAYPFYSFSKDGARKFLSVTGVNDTTALNYVSKLLAVLSVVFKGSLLSFATANRLAIFVPTVANYFYSNSPRTQTKSCAVKCLYGYGYFCSLTGGLVLAYMTWQVTKNLNASSAWVLIVCSYIGAAFGKVWAIKSVLDEKFSHNNTDSRETALQRLHNQIPNMKRSMLTITNPPIEDHELGHRLTPLSST